LVADQRLAQFQDGAGLGHGHWNGALDALARDAQHHLP